MPEERNQIWMKNLSCMTQQMTNPQIHQSQSKIYQHRLVMLQILEAVIFWMLLKVVLWVYILLLCHRVFLTVQGTLPPSACFPCQQ